MGIFRICTLISTVAAPVLFLPTAFQGSSLFKASPVSVVSSFLFFLCCSVVWCGVCGVREWVSVCVCTSAYVHFPVSMHVEKKEQWQMSSSVLPYFILEFRCLIKPGIKHFSRVQESLCLLRLCIWITMPAYYVIAEDLNSGPHSYAARILPVDPSH